MHVFDIGEVDVYQAADLSKRIHGIVSVGVVHNWNMETFFFRDDDRIRHLENHVRRRYKVDVMCAFGLETQHFICEFVNSQGSGLMMLEFLADLKILTEYATQIASREENRPRSFRAGDGRLFPEMQTGVRNPDLPADFANREFAFDAVHAAIARATDTVGELPGKWFVHDLLEYKLKLPRAEAQGFLEYHAQDLLCSKSFPRTTNG